jgi:hypothetical protein
MYQSNIPQSTDKISVSQGDLLGNFTENSTAWNRNHVNFNLANEGNHWYIAMPDQTPSGTFPPRTDGTGPYANSIGLYATGGQLWFRPAGQAVGVRTNDVNLTNTTAGKNQDGWVQFPSGIKMLWAYIASVPGGTTSHPDQHPGIATVELSSTYFTGFPGFTIAPYSAQVTGLVNGTPSPLVNSGFSPLYVGVPVWRTLPAPAIATVTIYNPGTNARPAFLFVTGI